LLRNVESSENTEARYLPVGSYIHIEKLKKVKGFLGFSRTETFTERWKLLAKRNEFSLPMDLDLEHEHTKEKVTLKVNPSRRFTYTVKELII
jgi:hypothetical protein